MKKPLRVLVVEDSEDDSILIIREIRRGGYEPEWKRVVTAETMNAALDNEAWDLIICDYSLPQFNALEALALVQERNIDLPFLIVSGTIGEDVAVEAMKAGADDYLMKDNLKRLIPTIERELREAEVRREGRKAQAAVEESERRLKEIFRGANEGILVADIETKEFLYANPAICNMFGYTEEEFTRLNVTDIHPQAELERVMAEFEAQAREEKTLVIDQPCIRKDGTLFYADINTTTILLDDRECNVGFFTDTTDRKRAERERRALANLGLQLVEADTIESMGAPLSQATNELLGWDAFFFGERLPGTDLFRRVYAVDTVKEKLIVQDTAGADAYEGLPEILDGESFIINRESENEHSLTRFGDVSRPSASLLFVPVAFGGNVYGVLSAQSYERNKYNERDKVMLKSLADIAAPALRRAQAERALRESRDRLEKMQLQHKAILRSTSHGLCMLNPDWLITWNNRSMSTILGFTSDTTQDLINVPFKTFLQSEEVFDNYKKSSEETMKLKGVDVRELKLKRYDGTQFWCEISIVRLDPSSTESGYVATLSDITERKQAEVERRQNSERIRRTLEETVHALVYAVEMRDPYTAGHQRGVSQLATAIAEEMGMQKEQIEAIRIAGLIHDIGKISIPAAVLSKPSKLSDAEKNLIKAHPRISFDILKGIKFPLPVNQIVLQHHERMNGSGYPHGLSGKDILEEARVLAVADVVEAMSSHRPYRPALRIDEALEEIQQNKDTLYDGEVVEACSRLFTEKGFKLLKIT